MKTALVIMAAGMGSRFGGGIKQLEPVGPNGEIIMDRIIHNNLSTWSHRCKLLDSFSKTTSDSCRHNYKCCFLHKYFPPDILLSYQYFFSHLLSHTLSAIFYSAALRLLNFAA